MKNKKNPKNKTGRNKRLLAVYSPKFRILTLFFQDENEHYYHGSVDKVNNEDGSKLEKLKDFHLLVEIARLLGKR